MPTSNEPEIFHAAPSASVNPLRIHGHVPVLDGVRGLAILMVLVFHFVGNTLATNGFERVVVGVTNYGSYGVELFFVLSGFLITGILVENFNDARYFRNFYIRRVLRIFPLYYGVLAIVFFVAPLVPLLQGPTLYHLIQHQVWAWLYAVNVYIATQGGWSFSYLDHLWSLAIEEHFYLVWPVVIFLLSRRLRVLSAVCLMIVLCATLARVIGSVAGVNWWTTYVLTPFRLDGLALGAFIAVMARQTQGSDRLVWAVPWVTTFAGGLLAVTFLWTRFASNPWLELVLPLRAALILLLLACLLVWAISAPETSVVSRLFRSRPFVLLGTYSYGLYVYHHFISYCMISNRTEIPLGSWLGSHTAAVTLQAALGISASLALAFISYELFEKRFLELKRLFDTTKEPAAKSKDPRGVSAEYVLSRH